MRLTDWWLNQAKTRAAKDVEGFESMDVVDGWKVDGYNDGTATLYLVCRDQDGTHKRITMEDYQPTVVDVVERKETVTHSWVAP